MPCEQLITGKATAAQVLGSGASSSGNAFPLSQVSWKVSKEEIIWAGSPWFVHLGCPGDKSPVETSVTLGRVQALGMMTLWLYRKGSHLDIPQQEWWQGMGTLGEAEQDPSHVNSGSPSSAGFGTTCFPACAEVITSAEFPDIGEINIYTHTAVSSSGGLLEKEQFMPRP